MLPTKGHARAQSRTQQQRRNIHQHKLMKNVNHSETSTQSLATSSFPTLFLPAGRRFTSLPRPRRGVLQSSGAGAFAGRARAEGVRAPPQGAVV